MTDSQDQAARANPQSAYESRGFLESVTLGSDTITYALDGQGRRVAREENGVVKDRFLYKDFINPVAWQDAGGSVAYFVYGGRGHVPDWMVKGGAYYRFVTDHLGSVRRVVNVETGTVAQAMDYDEWGNVIADSSPGFQPFGYAGGLYDGDTGLVHFGFREYNPETGRWMTKEPLGFTASRNYYVYAENNPTTCLDISGLNTIVIHLRGYDGPVAQGDVYIPVNGTRDFDTKLRAISSTLEAGDRIKVDGHGFAGGITIDTPNGKSRLPWYFLPNEPVPLPRGVNIDFLSCNFASDALFTAHDVQRWGMDVHNTFENNIGPAWSRYLNGNTVSGFDGLVWNDTGLFGNITTHSAGDRNQYPPYSYPGWDHRMDRLHPEYQAIYGNK